jgi:hypothetical protein
MPFLLAVTPASLNTLRKLYTETLGRFAVATNEKRSRVPSILSIRSSPSSKHDDIAYDPLVGVKIRLLYTTGFSVERKNSTSTRFLDAAQHCVLLFR